MPVSMYCAPPPDESRLRELSAIIRKQVHLKPIVHGTAYAYHNGLECRCAKCKEAHRKECRAWELENIEHRKKYQRDRYLRKIANKSLDTIRETD